MRQPFRNVVVDALMEERDHLLIRLNLVEDPDLDTRGSVVEMREEVARLETRIAELIAEG